MDYAVGAVSGIVLGWLSAYYLAIKPLIDDIRLMRYRGFQPNFPREERKEPVQANPHFSVED